jgi:hypothetical protein
MNGPRSLAVFAGMPRRVGGRPAGRARNARASRTLSALASPPRARKSRSRNSRPGSPVPGPVKALQQLDDCPPSGDQAFVQELLTEFRPGRPARSTNVLEGDVTRTPLVFFTTSATVKSLTRCTTGVTHADVLRLHHRKQPALVGGQVAESGSCCLVHAPSQHRPSGGQGSWKRVHSPKNTNNRRSLVTRATDRRLSMGWVIVTEQRSRIYLDMNEG